MPKYVLAYHGGSTPTTQAEQEAVMAAWLAWFSQLGDAVVDGGNPTGASLTVRPDGSTGAGGGSNPLTGYSLLTAADLDERGQPRQGLPDPRRRRLDRGRRDRRDVAPRGMRAGGRRRRRPAPAVEA